MSDVEAAVAAERERLVDLLHDDVMPLLALVRQELFKDSFDQLQAARRADAAIAALRGLMTREHPAAMRELDMRAALHAVCAPVCARARLDLELHTKDLRQDDRRLSDERRAVLLSGVRELAENAARHAAASRLVISAVREPDAMLVTVNDDGRGVNPEQVAESEEAGHLGLRRLRHRLTAVQGTLTLYSQPGRTTA